MQSKIVIGSDQMGFPLKQAVIGYLEEKGIEVLDVGPFSDEKPIDYPDYAQRVSKKVLAGAGESGIAICGTGIGMSIAVNKVPGIRGALCHDPYTAHQARAHNNANILCMGAWVVSPQRVGGILDEWLKTGYDGGRHRQRLSMLENHAIGSARDESIKYDPEQFQFAVAVSPQETVFGPLLFSGQLETGLQYAADSGFDMVELSLRNPDDHDHKVLHKLLSAKNLKLSAIATGQSCLHDSMCLASPDEAFVDAAVHRLQGHITLATHFGAAVIIGGVRGKLTGTQEEQSVQRQRAVNAIRVCAETASAHNVQLLIEPINRYETNFINTAEDGVALIEEMGHPEVKLLLDTFHMNIEEADIISTFRKYYNQLGYVHFADSNRLAPGQGHIDFRAVLSTLAELDYHGVISAEVLPLPDAGTAMQLTIDYLKPEIYQT